MKKNYICPTVECKAFMAESLMQTLTGARHTISARDIDAGQIFTGDVTIGVNNGIVSGSVTQDAKGGLSDWEDL